MFLSSSPTIDFVKTFSKKILKTWVNPKTKLVMVSFLLWYLIPSKETALSGKLYTKVFPIFAAIPHLKKYSSFDQ